MDEQQQPTPPQSGATPANPDLAQKASDDKLSRNLLIAGLLIVAVALGVHLMSPKEPAAGKPSTAANNAGNGSPMQPKAAPSIRGKEAPAVTLKNLEGKPVSLADFKGKAVLVNFWATWCQPCLLELPWFIQFQEKYGKDGFQVLAISLDEEGSKVVKPFVEKHNMKSLVVVMGEEKTPELFGGLLGLPTTFMVDRDGKLYSKHQGLVTKDEVEEEIQILVGAPVAQVTGAQAAQQSLRN
jgi:peroxiredoxin